MEYHQQALQISREIKDRQTEGNHLNNLGVVYERLGQPEKAKQHHIQALAIFEQIKSPLTDHARRLLATLDGGE